MARHCNFTLPIGQTFYTDKMVMHSLMQGLKNATIAIDVQEENATNNNLQDYHALEKKEKNIKVKRLPKGL